MAHRLAAYLLTPATGFLGRVAVIASAEELGAGFRGESHLLVERARPRLYATRITCELTRPVEGIDLDFMINEALTAADSRLADMRLKEFEQSKDWGLFSAPMSPNEIDLSAPAWATALFLWRAELKRISASTQQTQLAELLSVATAIQDLVVRDDLPLVP